jgi:isopenicillin N synthase-like dioxygenase
MDKSNTAYLQTLNFARLANKDAEELAKLLDACQHQGFFYLDLAGSDAAQGLEDRLKALSLTKEWFDRPLEEKMKLRQDSVTKGFVASVNDSSRYLT